MSIQKKISYFVAFVVLIPMLLLLIISTTVFNRQIERTEQSYLAVAMRFARTALLDRSTEVQQAGKLMCENSLFQDKLQSRDVHFLNAELQRFYDTFTYLDYMVLVDNENKVVLKYFPDSCYEKGNFFKEKAVQAMTEKTLFFSEEVLPIEKLFNKDSARYRRLLVKRQKRQADQEDEYLQKTLVGVNIIPILAVNDKNKVLGALIIGDALNNDNGVANYYTKNIKGSFLAFSVDGIRVSSSIITNTGSNYVGSAAPIAKPVKVESAAVDNNVFFGRDKYDNEVHIFLDEEIVNYEGKPVATMGVGIPEKNFKLIVANNFMIVIGVMIACLIIMLFAGRLVAKEICRPIVGLTNFICRYCEMEFRQSDMKFLQSKDEGIVLTETFHKMISKIGEKERESKESLKQALAANARQSEMAKQLRASNERLEIEVNRRTEYLQDAIKALKKVDVAKSNFMANISHELRTPLNVIIGSAEMLQAKIWGELTVKQEGYVASIHNSGEHLLQLINDVLDISKLAAGKMQLNMEPFYIGTIVRQTASEISSYVEEKQLHITIAFHPGDFRMVADQHKVKQIFYNILSNSAKFTNPKGSIDITITQKDTYMEAAIRDTGIGIPPQDLERVFQEFEQVDNSYSRNYEGTGLGLPIVKKLVEMHGGSITLKSKLGVGTELIFTLPLNAEQYLASKGAK